MVTTNPLSKCSVNVNYAPDRAYFNRKYIILRAFFFMLPKMTLTLDLETLFKVTAHPLSNGTLWVKYELNWANERVTSCLGWTDGQKYGQLERLITIGQPLSRALIKIRNFQ